MLRHDDVLLQTQLRKQQQAELAALLKRIEGRRREHIKQRDQDSKRLLQRNRNVQAVLESKQGVECKRRLKEIKAEMQQRIEEASRQRPDALADKGRPEEKDDGKSSTFITA